MNCVLGVAIAAGGVPGDEKSRSPVEPFEALLPRTVADLDRDSRAAGKSAAEAVEQWVAALVWDNGDATPERVLGNLRQVIDAKRRVDEQLERVLALRTQFAELPAGDQRQERLNRFLQITSRLVDLSGRLRYLLRDAVDRTAIDLEASPAQLEELFRLLIEQRVSVGAGVLADLLADPPTGSGAKPLPVALKRCVIELIGVSRQPMLLADLAEFVRRAETPADLRLGAALAIRRIGLPQEPRPGQDATLPKPPILAGELHALMARIPTASLPDGRAAVRDDFLGWLETRLKRGVTDESFRVGELDVRPGDWLLMRNPSPYNLFTDLSPGLFTHVGVVAVEQAADGFRRFVIVDLPERGDRIPATNVDAFLPRTLHYFLMRHRDPAIAAQLNDAALSVIGNESQFDLQFRTQRVAELKGKPLRGARIHTYCAGLLLLCAQETPLPRDHFFPITEAPAGGQCVENLRKLGLSIGSDFVSPTGAIFSPQMEIAGRCEPMYEPTREIRERVYDYFARAMIDKRLTPAPDAVQALRTKIAGASKRSPLLARALAKANKVSEHTDLESAAQAAAVVETLDEIAERGATEFEQAREALLAPVTRRELATDGFQPADIIRIERLRQRHAQLYQQWTAERLTPRQLRVALVDYYASQGERQLNERFFRP